MTNDTSNRARSIKRLVEVFEAAPSYARDGHGIPYPYYLLDNGVSVELPPVPEVKPGTTGTATVRGRAGVRVMKTDAPSFPWTVASPIDGAYWIYADKVTDFVPDVVVTRELVEEIIERLDGGPWARGDLEELLEERGFSG